MGTAEMVEENVWSGGRLAELLYGEGATPALGAVALELWRRLPERAPDDSASVVPQLLATALARDQRQQMAVVLLHGLHQDRDFLDQQGIAIRQRAVHFIDEALPELYRQHGIDCNEKEFNKLPRLRSVVAEAWEATARAAGMFISLERFEAARNEYLRDLGRAKVLFAPFVPMPLLRVRVGEVLEAVCALRDSDGPRLVSAYRHARELLEELLADAVDAGIVAERLLTPLVKQLESLCATAYNSNPVTNAGSLTVAAVVKKYPLSRPGEGLRLNVLVTSEGPGQILDLELEDLVAEGVALSSETVHVGHLLPGVTVTVTIPARTLHEPTDMALIEGVARWSDTDETRREHRFELIFEAQRSDLDWEALTPRYDLEPVSTASELVGRSEVLRELKGLVEGPTIGNAFIRGQRRVGKTSIALTLKTSLSDHRDLAVVYLEAGMYIRSSGSATIAAMGRRICQELLSADERFAGVEIPAFAEDTLSPLSDFVTQLRVRVPHLRVLVMLDEFSELPVELYRRGTLGDALFLSLRALAGQSYIGFVLIGGENMAPILDAQGDTLNKFESLPISYFDRVRHWDDFCDLIRRPVEDFLEISDDALVLIYDLSAGNPYFAKMICRALFKLVVQRRDAHVTRAEAQAAAEEQLATADSNSFAHFWEDGIIGTGEEVEQESVRRRKLLLTLAECVESGDRSTAKIEECAAVVGLDDRDVRELLREFARRDVLKEQNGEWHANVGLFDAWLGRYGVRKIVTTFTDPDAILHAKERERAQVVTMDEIASLLQKWDKYRGRAIEVEQVRAWLEQLDSVRAQRLMFGVLKGVRFYDNDTVRKQLIAAHAVVRRGLVQRLEAGRTKRSDILVTSIGGSERNATGYARMYADENGIYADCVVERGQLGERLRADGVQALVLLDEMLSADDRTWQATAALVREQAGQLRKHEIKVVVVSLAGFEEDRQRLAEHLTELDVRVELEVCDVLGPEHRCFGEQSVAFPEEAEREDALGIATSEGRRLERRQPLGCENAQATVVFEESCPTETLPILWSARRSWRPLFPRRVDG